MRREHETSAKAALRGSRDASAVGEAVDQVRRRAVTRQGQSRAMSLVEAAVNVAVGYGVALGTQLAVFPVVGLQVTLAQNLVIGSAFSAVSVVRSYLLRRAFEAVRVRGAGRGTAAPEGRRP